MGLKERSTMVLRKAGNNEMGIGREEDIGLHQRISKLTVQGTIKRAGNCDSNAVEELLFVFYYDHEQQPRL